MRQKLLSLLLAVCLSVGAGPVTALAADTAIMNGTEGIEDPTEELEDKTVPNRKYYEPSDYIYFGKDGNGDPIQWRVLAAEGGSGREGTANNDDGGGAINTDAVTYTDDDGNIVSENNAMFLLSEYLLTDITSDGDDSISFDEDASRDDPDIKPNTWQGSDTQEWCIAFAENEDNFSVGEQSAMLGTGKKESFGDDPAIEALELYDIDWGKSVLNATADGGQNRDKMFFLSTSELATYVGNYDRAPGLATEYTDQSGTYYWWLRSPSATLSIRAGVVSDYGDVRSDDVPLHSAVRPAFDLNLESVLFSSAAEGGKSAAISSGNQGGGAAENFFSIPEIKAYKGNEWKLTLRDSSEKYDHFEARCTAIFTRDMGKKIATISYEGAAFGTNEYVSAMIADDAGAYTHYGYLKEIASDADEDGEIQIDVTDIPENSTLYIFNEQCNGDKQTDYAGTFQKISLAVVDAETPKIDTHPDGAQYKTSDTNVIPLKVEASVGDDGKLTCQWYSNTEDSNSGGTRIEGATGAAYAPPIDKVGEMYYYCEVTNQNDAVLGNKTATAVSKTAKIVVIHEHVWSVDYSGQNETHHWQICSSPDCPIKDITQMEGYSEHVYDNATDTTCNSCSYVRNVTPPTPPHRHNWSLDWTYDGGYHWHECTASGCSITINSEKDGYGEHVYDSVIDETCNICGYVRIATEYTITFDGNGGTIPAPQITENGGLERLPKSTREGYIFEGWYTDAVGGDRITLTTQFTEDITVYAHWTKESHREDGRVGTLYYSITTEPTNHGMYLLDKERATRGETITVTFVPESGYVLDDFSITEENGTILEITQESENRYTFVMPKAKVNISAVFTEDTALPEPTPVERTLPFSDVQKTDWFYDAVLSVYENNIMSGTTETTFSPSAPTSRGMLVAMLYRMSGETYPNEETIFIDVSPSMYYNTAVAWAVDNGIASGMGDGLFVPNASITREQLAMFLYQYGLYTGMTPSTEGMAVQELADADTISDWAIPAVEYCINSGIISGKQDGTFSPRDNATRAEVASVLMRFLAV